MAADYSEICGLFAAHVQDLHNQLGKLAQISRVDGLVFGSGQRQYYFEDDQETPFRADHHFLRFCPVDRPGLYAVFSPNSDRPQLLGIDEPNHWEEPVEIPKFILDGFDVKLMTSRNELKSELGKLRSFAFVGSEKGICTSAAETLKQKLVELRITKSSFEVACVRYANGQAMNGHRMAEQAFRAGGSELEIYHAYLSGVEGIQKDLSYNPIIALNENGSVLHYQSKSHEPKQGRSLLIDAGYRFFGYASDITRTYSRDPGEFEDLVKQLDVMQQELVAELVTIKSFPDLHNRARHGVAKILVDNKLVTTSVGSCMESGLVDVFFPHGIGHLLGLLVHDVGGKIPGRKDLPSYLRCHLDLRKGMVFTVEPGLYFNPMLLNRAKSNPSFGNEIAWSKVDTLVPFGGIRIEDNIHFGPNGVENLTRS